MAVSILDSKSASKNVQSDNHIDWIGGSAIFDIHVRLNVWIIDLAINFFQNFKFSVNNLLFHKK